MSFVSQGVLPKEVVDFFLLVYLCIGEEVLYFVHTENINKLASSFRTGDMILFFIYFKFNVIF